jgi:hypothetical protein
MIGMAHYKGTVETLTVWKKNDGYFFEALNKEWFGRGVPLFKAGQSIEWDSGENFIKEAQLAEHITQPREIKPLMGDNETTTRLACIKAACVLLANRDWGTNQLSNEAVAIARKFEEYVKEG